MRKGLMIVAALTAAQPGPAGAVAFVGGVIEQMPAADTLALATTWSGDAIGSSAEAANAAGGFGRNVDTVAGQTYRLSSSLVGNPDGPPVTETVLTTASAGVTQTSTFDATGADQPGMGWRSYSYSFTAGGAATTLRFASADASAAGVALDPVSVTAVPEPAIWAMFLFGFFGLSFAVRRRDGGSRTRVRFT